MDKSQLAETLKDRIQPVGDDGWDRSVNAMQGYLTLLKKHSEEKAARAEEQLETHEDAMAKLKKKRRKRRNYGTRTGIVMQDGSDTSFEIR